MKYKNRVKDTTNTTGTGNITLDAAAIPSFRNFSPAYAINDFFPYCIVASDGSWEVGIGKLLTATTFQRHTILESSNADTVLTLPVGTHEVFVTSIAEFDGLLGYSVRVGANQNISHNTATDVVYTDVMQDPLNIITAALPTASLLVPDWADLIEVLIQTNWQSLSTPTPDENAIVEILDVSGVSFASPRVRYRDTLGGGSSIVVYQTPTFAFNPETVNGRGFRVNVLQNTGGTAQMASAGSVCQVKFI